MKTSADLLSLVPGLTLTEIGNWRKGGHLIESGRQGHKLLYSDKSAWKAAFAFKLTRTGVKPQTAFSNAEDSFHEQASSVMGAIAEHQERAGGRFPSKIQIKRDLNDPVDQFDVLLGALVEEKRLEQTDKGLLPSTTTQATGFLSSVAAPARSYKELSIERKIELREIALERYMSQLKIRQRPAGKRVPVPLLFLEVEGFSVDFRRLEEGVFGFNQPEDKKIILESQYARRSADDPGRRFVTTHEYFHVVLGHAAGTCAVDDEHGAEAEANYAAVHYLIPMYSFDLVRRTLNRETHSRGELLERLAQEFLVTRSIMTRYLDELRAMPTRLRILGDDPLGGRSLEE